MYRPKEKVIAMLESANYLNKLLQKLDTKAQPILKEWVCSEIECGGWIKKFIGEDL